MYNLNLIEENEKNDFLGIVYRKGLIPVISGDKLFVLNTNFDCIFRKKIDDVSVNDLSDLLGITIVDSKYKYYLFDSAYRNNRDGLGKRKSL